MNIWIGKQKKRLLTLKKRISEITVIDLRDWLELWGKRTGFYCGFYFSVGVFFMLHILVFMCFTWERVQPLNAGANLGYTNYPNNPFHFSSTPTELRLLLNNATLMTEGAYDLSAIEKVVNSNHSHACSCTSGHSERKCVLVHLNKVVQWQPQLVDLNLAFEDYLPINCEVDSEKYNVEVIPCSPGLPLFLNNTNGRSYPYLSGPGYQRPQMAVQIDFSNITDTKSIQNKVELTLSCNVRACQNINSIHCPIPLRLPIKIRK